ncbi:ROK family glucokinase [Aneurinibacillus aneurinilyticus]|uniref:ROK family glucokinase n=1 Tax=Aneurinibacillus aneurinilyticus TaxID=1391 RepID=UPI0023EFA446|nr:ROK family glucokinase [Aneurinibacillus aneurinilyticus]
MGKEEDAVYLCFDVGGTNIKAGLVDASGTILAKQSVVTQTDEQANSVLKQFLELQNVLCRESGITLEHIRAASIGVAGFVEMETGTITRAVNLGWHDVPVAEKVSSMLGMPVFVINDANAAALGEMWQGAGKGLDDLLCLTIGTGVGGGVIANGRIVNGAYGLAGEIGHFRVKIKDGRLCNCGKTGCLETEASASAIAYYGERAARQYPRGRLAQRLKQAGTLTSKDVAEAAQKGDKAACEVIEHAAYYLGYALASIFTVTAPIRIVIGGGVAAAGSLLFTPLIHWFREFALPDIKDKNIIAPAVLGNDAGIIGLAKLAKMNLSSLSGIEEKRG